MSFRTQHLDEWAETVDWDRDRVDTHRFVAVMATPPDEEFREYLAISCATEDEACEWTDSIDEGWFPHALIDLDESDLSKAVRIPTTRFVKAWPDAGETGDLS